MSVARRLFLGAFTAGAVTVAAEAATATPAAADGATTTFTGPVTAQKFYTDATAESAYFKTTSTTDNALTVYQASTTGTGAALNVASNNAGTSAMYLSGTETARGTLKITHTGYADGSDRNAAALSIDLRTAGTGCQGIYLTATNGPTAGELIVLRNNPNVDDFIVKGNGLIGIGIVEAATPRAQVHIRQSANTEAGLLVEGYVRVSDSTTAPNSIDSAGGGNLFAQNGALMWRGSNGTVTTIAPA
ncbi:hyaluronoglucosaminidase [Kitasatospora viridis]|uniref:Hyaluronidase-like protein HylP n=1 Tax=Kitasatospora viridis TaxID=281105 RepID=A0A561SEV4_9ACTN|nr:hyaluronoglucosaminidase [Kitasatospora viridis]TWF73367.1 hyaluronidase-like protein HylP [Kitasatospora viridis]